MQRKLKIVLFVSEFPQISETFIFNKFLALLEDGQNVHVVCQNSHIRNQNHFKGFKQKQDRVKVCWPHRPKLLAAMLMPIALIRCCLFKPLKTFAYLARGYKQFGLDIFRKLYLDAEFIVLEPDILHFEFGALSVGRTYLRELLDCKLVVSFRGYDLNFSGLEKANYYEEVWKNSDAIHCLGNDLWLRAQKRGCPEDQTHFLIPPAIDADFFFRKTKENSEKIGTPDRPLRLLSVGRLEWKKGYEFAMQAVRLLKDQGFSIEYRIVGVGNYLEALTFCQHQLNLEDTVILLGAKSREEVKDEMSRADVFLHAAVSEGFCNAVLEAQSMELPVVCSDADGLSENVEDGVTGFVVLRRDAKSILEKVACLMKDVNLRRQMGVNGRKRILNYFQLSEQIKAFQKLYSEITGDNE